jgi:hypothetical protein
MNLNITATEGNINSEFRGSGNTERPYIKIDYIENNTPFHENFTEKQRYLKTSTSLENTRQSFIEKEIENLFEMAQCIEFEDGIINEFSQKLELSIKKYSNQAMAEIAYLIAYEKVNNEINAEALKCLGRIEHSGTYHYRKWILEHSLNNVSFIVRDGALQGLSFLDDESSLKYIQEAIDKETVTELRKDMLSYLALFKK